MVRFVQFCVFVIIAVLLQAYVSEASVLRHPARNGANHSAFPRSFTVQITGQNESHSVAYEINPNLNVLPAVKSTILFTGSFHKCRMENGKQPRPGYLYLLPARVNDPVSYYVFGLRKIIT